jgi:hypothetical protein
MEIRVRRITLTTIRFGIDAPTNFGRLNSLPIGQIRFICPLNMEHMVNRTLVII